jgi:hypothetical protein
LTEDFARRGFFKQLRSLFERYGLVFSRHLSVAFITVGCLPVGCRFLSLNKDVNGMTLATCRYVFFTVALDKIDLFAQTSFFPTNGLLTILLFCYRDMSVMSTVKERDLWSETFEL